MLGGEEHKEGAGEAEAAPDYFCHRIIASSVSVVFLISGLLRAAVFQLYCELPYSADSRLRSAGRGLQPRPDVLSRSETELPF